jgi:hypothetical protein
LSILTDHLTLFQSLLEAGEHLRNIRHLALPSSVFTPKDHAVTYASWPLAGSAEELGARQEALINTASAERSAATKLGYVAQHLQAISFVRLARVSPEEKFDSAFKYTVNVTPEHTVYLGRNATPITRFTTVTVTNPIAPESAGDDQYDALPAHIEASRCEWRHRAIAFAQENPAVGVTVAVAGGLALSEAGRFLYARAIGA